MKKLSVIIPAYNEEGNLKRRVLDDVGNYLKKLNIDYEVIVVDDGSKDQTKELIKRYIAKDKKFKLIENSHGGKAIAVMTGMMAARGEVILFTDMDQATPIEEFDKLLSNYRNGFDVIIGSRNARREGAPLLRLIMARGFILLRKMILGLEGISDTQCGFKLFSQKSAADIFPRLKLYAEKQVSGPKVTAGFDVEILYLAQKLGYKIKEVEVFWHYVESRRVNPISESISGFFDMVQLKINDLRGLYR